jgi:propionyl-CoA carboxylase alpha chain
MFKKILIANRGEIACRIIKSAQKLGIKTVAVYSDADAGALHVAMADEAVHLGPPPAAQSYLLGEKIIEACLATGAQAVHPGYGFLSEREWFATACAEKGVVFIGPPPKAIAAMGDKIESKKLAVAAGVSVVPGFVGEISDTDHAAKIAAEIGYPVMMKASAGGGGKGMRLAFTEAEIREGFPQVRAEAKNAFGDDRVFIEKFVEDPRHIEIQVIGDQHGNVYYLGERDCSIQRRHQKVVEEAPSPFVTPEMRKAMGEQAVQLAKAVGYFSAGTVEFIAGRDRNFYFLEMNTRLQVEHPVTEMVTGLDLVELMLRVAAGDALPFKQADIKMTGWAMETRVYAEDPYRNFLPSIGRLVRYRQPHQKNGVRVDTGVIEGSEISMFYDPMIAKLITHAPTRLEAADLQIKALDEYYIRGIGHNRDFLSAVMQHPRFRKGEHVTTAFIADEYPDGFQGAPADEATKQQLIAVAAVTHVVEKNREQQIDGQLNGHGARYGHDWVVALDKQQYPVTVRETEDGYQVDAATGRFAIKSDWRAGELLFTGTINGAALTVEIDRQPLGQRLSYRGASHQVIVYTPQAAAMAAHMIEKVPADMSKVLLCPMPGLVIAIDVKVGDVVQPGQTLCTVEAMKMQNILRAEKTATIAKINAKPGDSLAVDAVILEFVS